MSDKHSVSSYEGEDEEAFLDMDDPDNVVVDDGEGAQPEVDSDDDGADVGGDEEAEEDGADDEDGSVGLVIEPVRDDSVATFAAMKPLHSIDTHPSKPIISVGSEDDNAFACAFDSSKSPEATESGTANLHTTLLQGHTDTVTCIAYSPNGTQLATGGMDCVVHLWDLTKEGMPLQHKLTDLSGEIQKILWHPSGMALVASASDAQAAMWNSTKGTLVQYFVGHRDAVNCVAWSSDVKKLITAGADSNVIVFNPKTGEAEKTITKDISAGVTCLQVLGAESAIVGCEDGGLQLVSLTGGKVLKQMNDTHQQAIESLGLCSSTPLLAACSCDCTISIWNLDMTQRATLKATDGITKVLWLGHLILGTTCNGCVCMWDGRQANPEPTHTLVGHRAGIWDMATLTCSIGDKEEQQCVATVSDDCTMKIFPLPGPNEKKTEKQAEPEVSEKKAAEEEGKE